MKNNISPTGKLLAISISSAILALLPWQTSSLSQNRVICDYYGCYPAARNCNAYGCWQTPTGNCNAYGCSEYGVCTPYGCPSYPAAPYPRGFCPSNFPGAVIVELIARGDDWANVWIDGREVFQPRNFDRRKTVTLCPGAYRVIITGITRFEVWASGYLDVGRTNVVRIAFSKDRGVEIAGDVNAWLPDNINDPVDVWER